MQTVEEKLNDLATWYAQRDTIVLDKQAATDAVLPAEIVALLAEIEADFTQRRDAVMDNIATLEAEIKAAVLALGKTVDGVQLKAVFSKGRVTWDSKKLDGYAAAHPEVLPFRKEGEPSVSIRKAV